MVIVIMYYINAGHDETLRDKVFFFQWNKFNVKDKNY